MRHNLKITKFVSLQSMKSIGTWKQFHNLKSQDGRRVERIKLLTRQPRTREITACFTCFTAFICKCASFVSTSSLQGYVETESRINKRPVNMLNVKKHVLYFHVENYNVLHIIFEYIHRIIKIIIHKQFY